MANPNLPSLQELLQASMAGSGGVGEALQSGLGAYLAERKVGHDKQQAELTRQLEQAKLALTEKQRQTEEQKLAETVRHNQADEKSKGLKLFPGDKTGIPELAGTNVSTDAYMNYLAQKNKPANQFNPGETAVDKQFAGDYNDYVLQGGAPALAERFGKLQRAKEAYLKLDPGMASRASGILPESVRGLVAPQLKSIEQDIRNNVLELLRKTLGGQFAQQEGEKIFSQTFDSTLPKETNLAKIESLERSLQAAAKAKQQAIEYYQANGTLKGFQGQLPAFDGPSVPTQSALPQDKAARLAELRAKRDAGTLGR